jgi:outer membrane protein assembly factor BamA
MRRAPEILAVCLALALVAPAASLLASDPPPRIGQITIESDDLFTDEEASHGTFYRGANFLHQKTRPSLIRKFLLFNEGDPYDAETISETERNLRALDFLKSVSIVTSPAADGVVDIVVHTQDAWTTDPNADYNRQSGSRTFSFNVTQKNLFGSGGEASVTLAQGLERTVKSIELTNPAFIVPYLGVDTTYASNSDGFVHFIELSRPHFSYATRFGFDAVLDRFDQNQRLFDRGEESAIFRRVHRRASLAWSYAVRSDAQGSDRLTIGVDDFVDRFSSLGAWPEGVVPDRRAFRFFEIGYARSSTSYAKLNWIDNDASYQDFTLGAQLAAKLGASPYYAKQHEGVYRASIEASDGIAWNGRLFLLPAVSYSARYIGNAVQNGIATADVRLIYKLDTQHPATWIARVHADSGANLDQDIQFYADGMNGMRAFPAYAFEGDRRILLNVEQRYYLGREIAQLFSPSLAVFLDAGTATAANAPVTLGDVKKDAGFGIRLGIQRFGSTTLRFDFAYALDPSPISRKGLVFSFGTTQAF